MRNRDRQRANTAASEGEEPEAPPAPEAQGDGEPAPGDGVAATQRTDGADIATTFNQQLADQRDKYLRLAAEYDNFRKRTAKERVEAGARGQAELVTKLIDALDDLSRFAHVDPAATDSLTLHKGIELVEQKALKVLENAGLTILNPVDQNFDPTMHEAISTEPALSPEDDHTVGKVFQRGYMFNGQLLRPALVVVKQWRTNP